VVDWEVLRIGVGLGMQVEEKKVVGEMKGKEKVPVEEDKGRIDDWVAHLTTQVAGHRDAIQGLRGLTKTSSINRDYIARKGAIPVVVEVLKDAHEPEVRKHAVTLLLNLSITAALKGSIMAAGAVEPIVEVLKHGDHEARENAAAALFSLSAKGANGALIGSTTDAIPALVQLLIDGTRRGKLDAATAIFDLCICNENKPRAVQSGVIPPLVRLLTDANLKLQDQALSILALLAVDLQAQAEIARVNALPILVDLVAESNPQNRENAACVLLELCSNDPNNVYNATKLGLCGALGELASTGTAKARRKARKLLEIFRHAQHLTGPPGARSI
jgi:HEAT repeat protein